MFLALEQFLHADGSVARRRALVGSVRVLGVLVSVFGLSWATSAPANAASWSIKPTPNPLGAESSALSGVSCTSRTACAAVGSYTDSTGKVLTLAERWNGVMWSIQNTPNPSGANSSSLAGVSCSGQGACIAVGSSTTRGGPTVTLAERWNGVRWTIQPTPNPSGATTSSLAAVSCTKAGACTAAGSAGSPGGTVTLAERWNGTVWSIQPTFTPEGPFGPYGLLYGVSCTSTNACIAVGDQYRTMLSERWDGATSTFAPMSTLPGGIDGSHFPGVSCTTATACTAVGYYDSGTGAHGLTLAERWGGSTWQMQSSQNPDLSIGAANVLYGVSCVSLTRCTAVGLVSTISGVATLAERWQGGTWSVQSTPNYAGSTSSSLAAVSCMQAGPCIAVGSASGDTLAEQYA